MRISGQITQSDFIRAVFVHIRPRPTFAILGTALVVLTLGVTIWVTRDALVTGHRVVLSVSLVGTLTYLAVYFIGWLPFRAAKTYKQYKAVSLPFVAEIGGDGIRIESELGSGILPWSHIHRWREGKSLFLLYPTDVLYHILPKSAFSRELLEEFRTVLAERLGQAA